MGVEDDEDDYKGVTLTAQVNTDISVIIVVDSAEEAISELNLLLKEYDPHYDERIKNSKER